MDDDHYGTTFNVTETRIVGTVDVNGKGTRHPVRVAFEMIGRAMAHHHDNNIDGTSMSFDYGGRTFHVDAFVPHDPNDDDAPTPMI